MSLTDAGHIRCELKLTAHPDDLKPGDKLRLTSGEYESGEPITSKGKGFLTMIILVKKVLHAPIRYSDVMGTRYITYVETGVHSVRILRPSRRFGLREKLRYYAFNRLPDTVRDFMFRQRRRVYLQKHQEQEGR